MSGGFTYHGGALAAAARHFGGQDWLDLSTGINPTPWPGVIEADWQRLPEREALVALEAAAAAHFGVSPEYCCAVPGSEMALRVIGQWLGRGAYRWPSYRTHAAAFPDGAAGDGPGSTRAFLLANPNNPDGRITPARDLQVWHDDLAARDGWLVVDEAFADATPEVSLAGRVGEWPRLIVLRSFGKFFGLAGLRLGFVLGPEPVMAMLRGILGDWPLGAGALAAGHAAYRDGPWIAQARRDLAARAGRMDDLLASHGFKVLGECPHFRLIEGVDSLFGRLARHRILTRPFDYDPRWLRLGIPAAQEDWLRLDRALGNG
ncbi:cobalamin biosynthetic protein CobC [Novosphingobium sp. SG751A]|uniref:aminotransferase class I/II-fold pyridoxal phosphate-dependent enzyme n=1 Tax=Novosphingobium sp. SG751A TaxID=2587000 RepID=UPI001556F961|nr:aminotransferase class I/II-fold pyridoxal phosphate-dependent enzyme [Novosphingobium sp. SG751A]NOW45813.1 cobalamin biosynthetic protein CobC [Novosphingobium sp. SG751A]